MSEFELRLLIDPLRPVGVFALIALVALTLSRLGLAWWQAKRVNAVKGWRPVLLQGVRVDVATICWLWGVPLLLTVVLGGDHPVGHLWMMILRLWLMLGLWLLLFMELSTPAFISEYGFRPNSLYVEYLIYPKEVSSMLWRGHKGELLLGLVSSLLVLSAGWWLSGVVTAGVEMPAWYWRPVLAVLVIALAVMGGRSTFGHRALNPSLVAFSSDPLVNTLPLNSSYSVMFAIAHLGEEEDPSRFYGKLPAERVIELMRAASGRPAEAFVSRALPSISRNPASRQGKPKNLVILLQESLGARFVGNLGGLPLTPHIDALSLEGWNFRQLYATGTRSVRGIEAVVAGFTPTPAPAVVRLDKSQRGFFTLAALLREQGYDTSFIYGGESHFDNMRGFFLGNGFTRIVEQKDFSNPNFSGVWGVSDEDLMRKAHDEFTRLHGEGKPFFSLVFSSSNHDPFEFPDGRIDLYEQPKATRNNAAKYADHAVGEFFKAARAADYWQDTLFLVIADHDSRVGGADLVPIPRFHIPGLIVGEGVPRFQDERVVSQIDIAPTLLSLMGISADYPMLGRDLTRTPADWPGRAMMQYDKNFALMEGNQVVVLQPEHPAESFEFDFSSGKLIATSPNDALKEQALAWSLWGGMAYKKSLYRLPD